MTDDEIAEWERQRKLGELLEIASGWRRRPRPERFFPHVEIEREARAFQAAVDRAIRAANKDLA